MTIQEYATNLAAQMGINLSKVDLAEGHTLGCFDASILSMESNGKTVSEFVHLSELGSVKSGSHNELLELKISAALARLKIMLED